MKLRWKLWITTIYILAIGCEDSSYIYIDVSDSETNNLCNTDNNINNNINTLHDSENEKYISDISFHNDTDTYSNNDTTTNIILLDTNIILSTDSVELDTLSIDTEFIKDTETSSQENQDSETEIKTNIDSETNSETEINIDSETETKTSQDSETDSIINQDTDSLDTSANECKLDWDCETQPFSTINLVFQYNCYNNKCIKKPLCEEGQNIKCVSIEIGVSHCSSEYLEKYRCDNHGLVCCKE